MDTTLQALETQVKELAELAVTDLDNQEVVDSLVGTLATINQAKKDATKQEKEIKDTIKNTVKEYTDKGESVTLYSPAHGKKVTVTQTRPTEEIDPDLLLKALYESYGEEEGDKDGNAWEAFLAVTDSVRVINVNKLALELGKIEKLKAGTGLAIPKVTKEEVKKATKITRKGSINCKVANLNKTEKTSAKNNELPTRKVE